MTSSSGILAGGREPEKARYRLRRPTSVFEDEQALTVRDEISAVDEPRFLTLGRDLLGRLLW